jgi:hypothetical protein
LIDLLGDAGAGDQEDAILHREIREIREDGFHLHREIREIREDGFHCTGRSGGSGRMDFIARGDQGGLNFIARGDQGRFTNGGCKNCRLAAPHA